MRGAGIFRNKGNRAARPGRGSGEQVASSGSGAAMAWSSRAASSTVRVKGPIWSSELAKAIRP